MHIIDGKIYQKSRKWYTFRETHEIYAKGGVVVLKLAKSPTEKNEDILREHDPRNRTA